MALLVISVAPDSGLYCGEDNNMCQIFILQAMEVLFFKCHAVIIPNELFVKSAFSVSQKVGCNRLNNHINGHR